SDPQTQFVRRWALTILHRVLDLLKLEYDSEKKAKLFEVLSGRLSGGDDASTLADLAKQLEMKEGAIKVALHRMRKRYRDLLRAEIAQTVANADDCEDEIRELFAVLSS